MQVRGIMLPLCPLQILWISEGGNEPLPANSLYHMFYATQSKGHCLDLTTGAKTCFCG